MVKITDGKDVFEVSKGAFDGIYSHQGFHLFKENKKEVDRTEAVGKADENAISEDMKWCNEMAEKPVAQWNKDDIVKFAKLNDIDLNGTKNANEARERCKLFIDSKMSK